VRTQDGLTAVQPNAGAVLSMVDLAEEILDSDPTCSVAYVIAVALAERDTHTRPARAARHTHALRTAETPVYIAHRRLLI
jgi:hypothetical protein